MNEPNKQEEATEGEYMRWWQVVLKFAFLFLTFGLLRACGGS